MARQLTPSITTINGVADICEDYFAGFDLHYFSHIKVKRNGQYSFIASKHDWPIWHMETKLKR